MPKMKTHRGAAKRFKITGSGKIMRRKANLQPHPREEAVEAQAPPQRRLEVADGDAARVKRMLGI